MDDESDNSKYGVMYVKDVCEFVLAKNSVDNSRKQIQHFIQYDYSSNNYLSSALFIRKSYSHQI